MKNEILLEVWRNRDEFAKRHNFDLRLMVEALQKSERTSRNRLVDRSKTKPANRSKATSRLRKS